MEPEAFLHSDTLMTKGQDTSPSLATEVSLSRLSPPLCCWELLSEVCCLGCPVGFPWDVKRAALALLHASHPFPRQERQTQIRLWQRAGSSSCRELPGPVRCFWEGPCAPATLIRMTRRKDCMLTGLSFPYALAHHVPSPLLYCREGQNLLSDVLGLCVCVGGDPDCLSCSGSYDLRLQLPKVLPWRRIFCHK